MADKKTKKIQINSLTTAELTSEAKKLKTDVIKVRLGIRARRERNTRKGFSLRKQLARTLTVLKQKQLEIEAKKGV